MGNVFVFSKGDAHDVVGLDVLGKAVADGLSFQLLTKGTKPVDPR